MSSAFAPYLEHLRAVACAPSGRRFAVAGVRDAQSVSSSAVHLFGTKDRKHAAAIALNASVGALAFLANDLLVVGCADGKLVAIDADAAAPVVRAEVEGPGGGVLALAVDGQGQHLAVVTESGWVGTYRLETTGGTPGLTLLGHRNVSPRPLRCATFDPSRPRVAVAGDAGVVAVVAVADDAASVREIPAGEGGIRALAATDDGRIVVGCGDGSLRISYLDGAADEEDRSKDAAHERAISALVLGPVLRDDAGRALPRRLFSAGEDGVLKSWPLDSRRKPKSVELGTAAVLGLAWAPATSRAKDERRGGTLVAIDAKRTISVCTLDISSVVDESVDRVRGRLAEHAQQLQASSVKVREAALQALGEVVEDDARKLIERALTKDDKPEVRKLAAEVLGLTGRRPSRAALRGALADADKGVRRSAYEALLLIDDGQPLPTLRAALAGKHADLRFEAVRALPPLRSVSPLVLGLVADALADRDPKVRHAAFEGLYAMEPVGARNKLVAPARVAMAKGPEDIRATALFMLGRTQASETLEGYALVEDALDDVASTVRHMAFSVAISSRVVLGRRLYALDPQVKEAIDLAHKQGPLLLAAPKDAQPTEDDLAPLFAALICRNPDTALRGARSLALLADPRATGALLQLSREQDAALRRAVVATLLLAAQAMPADDRLRTRLEWLLDDSDAGVRTDAFDALRTLASPHGDKGALQTAAIALGSGQADVRERAMAIAVAFGPKAAAEHAAHADALLSSALDDEASSVRATAYKTLWAWHSETPQAMLERASASRHADTRQQVVGELDRTAEPWAEPLLLTMVRDTNADVGLSAYNALTRSRKNKPRAEAQRARAEVHLAAAGSPRASVRAAACRGARHSKGDVGALRVRLTELLDDESVPVHEAAIEALDTLVPNDQNAFAIAYGSKFWTLRVRAAELHGKRRNDAAVAPMRSLLALPEGDRNRPPPVMRQRAAAAMADVADAGSMASYVTLLDDEDASVREMGARGLAGAVKPGLERPLVAALSHDDLPVRSWVAEGLARLGDVRAVPVLAGTLAHDHKPIRLGAILSFVALGADGLRGVLQGLEDVDREVQDLVFAIVVARDVALARAGLGPDLLMAALAASSPELRFAAARALEVRSDGAALDPVLEELVGPQKPDRAADLKTWPAEDERRALLNVLVSVLASEDPSQRYAAARVLSLRPQADAFWREVKRLRGPQAGGVGDAPATAPEAETSTARKRGWIHRLAAKLTPGRGPEALTQRVLEVIRYAGGTHPQPVPPRAADEDISRVVFGTYVGLVRQAPAAGGGDETHRIRRDALARLGALALDADVGRAAVLPAVGRALSDPHHLVRKAASATLEGLYPKGDSTPATLALQADFADVGRGAVDALVSRALTGNDAARGLALQSVNAANKDVRAFAVTKIQQLFDAGSLEPWLVALESRWADVRLLVVNRLVDARDERVDAALARALESDHDDLRQRAALALAKRGAVRAIEVLAGLLRHDEARTVTRGIEGLVTLARARENEAAASQVALALANRMSEDPDQTADVLGLLGAIRRVGHPDGEAPLLALVAGEDVALGSRAFAALLSLATHRSEPARTLADGRIRRRFDDGHALRYAAVAAAHPSPEIRVLSVGALRDVDDAQAEPLLARLLDDRDSTVRVAAAQGLSFRAEAVEGAGLEALAAALRRGRRDLVLPAAAGMAKRRRPEALQPLLLVLKAGEHEEREQALLSLGHLADARCLPDVEPLVDPDAEISDEDRLLAPTAIEALGRMLARITEDEAAARVRSRVEVAAREGGSTMRRRALSGLRWAGDDRSRGLLEAVVADNFDDAAVRRHAVNLLGELAHPDSEGVLSEAVSDADRNIRQAAAQALGVLFADDPTRANMLRLRSSYSDVAEPAASFLARTGEADSLLDRLPLIQRAEVRQRLRRGLVRREALPTASISKLLSHHEVGPRTEAAWLAGSAAEAGFAAGLAAAAQASAASWEMHHHKGMGAQAKAEAESWRACLWAARRCGASLTLAETALQTTDAPSAVLTEALRLLASVGKRGDADRARPLLTHPEPSVRVAAARALTALDAVAGASLAATSDLSDGRVVASVADAALEQDALAALSSPGRAGVLPRALARGELAALADLAGSGETASRRAAIEGLGRLATPAALEALENLLGDAGLDESLRKASFRALRRGQRRNARTAALAQLEETP